MAFEANSPALSASRPNPHPARRVGLRSGRSLRFRLVRFLIRGLALLPLGLLYVVSDLAFVLAYYIARYRRRAVSQHLAFAFPEKTEAERAAIRRRFFRQLMNYIVETVRLFRMTNAEMLRRYTLTDEARRLLGPYAAEVGGIVALGGHQFHWEWLFWALQLHTPLPVLAMYKEVKSPLADDLINEARTQLGSALAPTGRAGREAIKAIRSGSVVYMVADQSTVELDRAIWLPFMGPLAPFQGGVERLMQAGGKPVVFISTKILRRGHYQLDARVLAEAPQALPPGELTAHYAQALEASIRQQPHNYLWSHKRWKYPHAEHGHRGMTYTPRHE